MNSCIMMVRFRPHRGGYNVMTKFPSLKKSYIITITLTLLIVLLAIIFRSTQNVRLMMPKADLSEGWMIDLNGNETLLTDYPTRVNVEPWESYTIYKTLPASEEALNLLISTDHQDVTVKLDDTMIYISTQQTSSVSFYANLHHVVTVGHDTGNDHVLSITFHSPYAKTAGLIYPIYESLGSTGTLYATVFFQHIWAVGFGLLFMIMGIIVLSISHIVDKSRAQGRLYLALFAIVFGAWVIAKSTLLQFITNNAYLLGGLQKTLFMIIPIPLLMYYKGYITKKFEKETLGLIGYFGLQSIVVTTLQLFGILDFVQPAFFVSIMTLICMVILLVFIVIDVLNSNERAKKFSRYYGILFLYGFVTFINGQLFNYQDLSIYSLAVLGLFSIIIFIDYIFFIEKRLKLSYLSEDYAKLAYLDRLTGSKNRHAYEEDFERFFHNGRIRQNLRLVFFDLDGLKQINDKYGHVEGDFALKEGFSMILNAFGRFGDCYRIGGDEFACIIQSLDDDLYDSCRKQLIHDVKSLSAYHKFDLRISVGTSIFDDKDANMNDMIVRADRDMYENKNNHRKEG